MRYSICLADPPWSYSDEQKHRPENYDRMPSGELRALPVSKIMAPDSALFLWATGPMLPDALSLMYWWGGFRYVTPAFVWSKTTKDGAKPRNTQGHYSLPNHEFCLLGIRGRLPVVGHPRQEVREPPRGHSQKPDCVRDRIVEMFGDLPRIELFARGAPVAGWAQWGDEAKWPVQLCDGF